MILKKEANILVTKLRSLLLLEADYNAMNKIIFNTRLIPSLELYKMIPTEIIGDRRGMSAICIALNKKLQADIANQAKLSSIIVYADV